MPKLPSRNVMVVGCSVVIVVLFITLVVLMTTVEPNPLPESGGDGTTSKPTPQSEDLETTAGGRRTSKVADASTEPGECKECNRGVENMPIQRVSIPLHIKKRFLEAMKEQSVRKRDVEEPAEIFYNKYYDLDDEETVIINFVDNDPHSSIEIKIRKIADLDSKSNKGNRPHKTVEKDSQGSSISEFMNRNNFPTPTGALFRNILSIIDTEVANFTINLLNSLKNISFTSKLTSMINNKLKMSSNIDRNSITNETTLKNKNDTSNNDTLINETTIRNLSFPNDLNNSKAPIPMSSLMENTTKIQDILGNGDNPKSLKLVHNLSETLLMNETLQSRRTNSFK